MQSDNTQLIEKSLTFSELSLIPSLFELPDYDEKYVAWLGVLMPYSMALTVVGSMMGAFPSPEVKRCVGINIIRGIRSNVLGDLRSESWRNMLRLDEPLADPIRTYSRIASMFQQKLLARRQSGDTVENYARECLDHLNPAGPGI